MKNILRLISIGIFVLLMVIACKTNKTVTKNSEVKPELCIGSYLTEEEGAQNLKQSIANYKTAKDWKLHANTIRKSIFEGADLNRIPKKEWNYPIKITKSNRHEMDGYSVENISLEVKPGYFITGNLYQPLYPAKLNPAILSPHGHWFEPDDYGRFRPDMQKRCASFSRMGAIVFAYDMTGTGEDIQHIHLDSNALTRQTYNGIRILDFITSLKNVDPKRIGITGASGGGTQTFLLAAIDDRISVSVPVVMVSAHFFGGCVCESGKPVHKNGGFETNNVEIAASIAPKPLMIMGDGDDWTKNITNVEFPFIQYIYKLFGAEDNCEYAYFPNEVHNYGFSKRKAAYKFLAKHLKLDINKILNEEKEINEIFVVLLDTTQLKAFPNRNLVPNPMMN